MKGNVVVMSGGLGNQLFQFAFLHNLSDLKRGAISCFFPITHDGARDFMLSSLCSNCTHVDKVNTRSSRTLDLRFKALGFVQNRFPKIFMKFFSGLDFVEKNTYSFENLDISFKYYSGYFQHWKHVHNSLESFESELDFVIDEQLESLPEFFSQSPYGVVHFRQGDLLNYRKTMGNLNFEYFEKSISAALTDCEEEIRVIVLTDDKDAALKHFVNLAVEVYGPDEISEWQGLAAMSAAKFVITSNSTFSWWGALLASRRGGIAYIPSPWFLNWQPAPGDAFNFPGFKSLPSTFEQ